MTIFDAFLKALGTLLLYIACIAAFFAVIWALAWLVQVWGMFGFFGIIIVILLAFMTWHNYAHYHYIMGTKKD